MCIRDSHEIIHDLKNVIVPPYDVITPEEQNQYYDASPHNYIRINLNNTVGDEKYSSAANTLNMWVGSSVLIEESQPAIYILSQSFLVEGNLVERIGCICALTLSELGDEELVSAIGIKKTKKGYKVDKENRIYTLVHSILRPNGEIRVRSDINKLPNWKFIKAHYLGCKPYHMKQGVCASNYKHWMRRAVSEYAFPDKLRDKDDPKKLSANSSDFQLAMTFEQLDQLKKARTKVDKMTQKIWYVLRKMIIEDGLR